MARSFNPEEIRRVVEYADTKLGGHLTGFKCEDKAQAVIDCFEKNTAIDGLGLVLVSYNGRLGRDSEYEFVINRDGTWEINRF